MTTALAEPDAGYSEKNLVTLKDAAHIRQNPGMYVGNTQASGLHHIVYEVVYNSVDEALAGYCTRIAVALHPDGSISVADDGRGIPVGVKADSGKSTLEDALTVAGTSGKFDNAAYRVSAGLHGMGAKAMNALSEWCEAEVRRDGRVYKMEFERGYATTGLQDLGPAVAGQSGTAITFKPDPEVFADLTFDYDTLADRFREIAYLNKGLALALADERDGRTDLFKFDGGIAEFVAFLNEGEQVEHQPIYTHKTIDGISVEVALQYSFAEDEKVRCYTNNAYNPVGGTHLSGFRGGLTKALNAYGKKENHFKPDMDVKSEDFRSGLTAVVSLGHPDPVFESQTKIKLNNPEVEGVVGSAVYEFLTEYLEKNPKEAAKICKRIALAAELRLAAKAARDALAKRKTILSGGGLPGKLMDCTTRDREKSELFLVEGDSAGGSAESGRDRMYQAVLPLKGKVLNVEKARIEKLLRNEEIASLIAAVGMDIGPDGDTAKVRYGKIIILTDADVDGQHIRTLLLTFFFRQMRKLVEEGRVFVSRPPLFKVTTKKEKRFVQTREEMAQELMTRGLKETVLRHTPAGAPARTLDAAVLAKLFAVLHDAEAAAQQLDRRGHPLDLLVRDHPDGRFPTYHVGYAGKELWFHTADEVEAFRAGEATRLGKELVLADAAVVLTKGESGSGERKPAEAASADAARYTRDEWHEVRTLNRVIGRLKEFGFGPTDLIPPPRVAGREPPVRFVLERDDSRRELAHMRELVAEIRRFGEKGLSVTRFKGLGEMDPDELWETTLDPQHRTLLKVTLNDAQAAEKLFRTLMGEEVEGRREFIFRHRIHSADDIDYGA